MGNSNTVNVVTLLIVIGVYGLVCWGEHLECPAQDWILGSTITLRCYVSKVNVPAKCTFRFTNEVFFTRQPLNGSLTDVCKVDDFSTTSCASSNSECGCDTANDTYFITYRTFTVKNEDDGTWKCTVGCLDNSFASPLTFSSANCDDRTVEEPPKPSGLTPGEIAGIVIGCLLAVGVIIGVIIYCKIKKKCCFAETTTEDERERRNATPMNDHGREKPPNPNASDKPLHTNDTTMAEHDANRDGRPRELPQPKRRPGATVTPNETPRAVDNPSSSPGARQLPLPRVAEHNMTTSLPPPSLPPLRNQAATSLTSVERNSYAESKQPLPAISPREAQ